MLEENFVEIYLVWHNNLTTEFHAIAILPHMLADKIAIRGQCIANQDGRILQAINKMHFADLIILF